MELRPARKQDCERINAIYNWYIENTAITFDVEPWTLSKRLEWFEQFASIHHRYNVVVAESAGQIIGFACNTRFRPKAAYDSSTEVTVYTGPGNQTRGVGSALYQGLFKQLSDTDLHRAYAIISLPNDRSISLHQKHDFQHIGTLDEVGTKFGKRVDVSWFQKKL